MIKLCDKKDCTGCSSCYNVCVHQALSMQPDKEGFLYPVIDVDKCKECSLCEKACPVLNEDKLYDNDPAPSTYALCAEDSICQRSSSGGAFSLLAMLFINRGGVVFGAAINSNNEVYHTSITSIDDLDKLRGSKYVQSAVEETYKQARQKLSEGRKVLFSGTPCQIAGLYGYLKKDYNNLWTIDVICHGVPNAKFFNDYLGVEAKKRGGVPIGYSFRDKKRGWGMNARLDLRRPSGGGKSIYIPARLTSYNTLFLDGDIYRENCYECPYAHKERVADMTIGDFWGIEREHPELPKQDAFDERKGISCILANTEKGVELCKKITDRIWLSESSYDKIAKKNGQLSHPSVQSSRRKIIMELYEKAGYDGVEKWFHKKYRKQIIVHSIYNAIPRKVRVALKSIIKN